MKTNATWLITCRAAADLLNLLLFVLVSRQFGPEGTGQYAYAFAIAGFLYAVTTMGVDDYAIREYTRVAATARNRLLEEVLGTQLCVTALGLMVLGIYLVASQPDSTTLWCILALTAYQLANALAKTLFVPAMAEQQMVKPSLSFLASRSLAFVVAGILILHGSDLATALTAFTLSALTIMVLGARSAKSHGHSLRAHVSTAAMRTQTQAMWSFASIGLLSQVLARISVVALTLLSGGAIAGVYATGLKIIEAMCLPIHFIGTAAYPRLCRTFHADPSEFKDLQRKLLILAGAAALLTAAVMQWVVPWLLVPVFGEHYATTHAIIASMAILAFAQSAEIMPGRIMFAADLQVQRAGIIAIAAITCAVLNFALVGHFGIDAAIGATSVAYLGTCALYIVLLYARSNREPSTDAATAREYS
jgi:O-antigen/teichoic acid export membrane protein